MERLFNLDAQLLHDALLLAIAIFVMFALMSYLLFNPARDMLKKRADKVKDNIDSAEKAKADAEALRAEYEGKLREVQKEADAILSDARKKALENEAKIIDHAKEEAAGIIARAQKQAELDAAGLWHFIFADESAEAVRRIISAYRVGMSADACGITAFKRL